MIEAVPEQVGKLIRLLASDSPGEVLGAVAALRRVLESAGMDLNDLGAFVEQGKSADIMSAQDRLRLKIAMTKFPRTIQKAVDMHNYEMAQAERTARRVTAPTTNVVPLIAGKGVKA